ncbi:HISTIDINE AMMONIA-LYASE [Plasmopara halstedii]|uniref:HISTIDINE AMMONIA-LYASE n=1 Tax=Plasmopara halstedii TaxID=4781 RepID=A0A0P1ATP3_PLAHL|nr:HISTIDINE AMMONIA-LYASE [Plasmopara halstedii]CEG44882.1 HISTIDINE AMMONIA-LYASE [Plasmopara halstedii]|eukprot:XP_024581251.1 HISTIDINE AMMONIA-LYASE [Plasmopara halstedii]
MSILHKTRSSADHQEAANQFDVNDDVILTSNDGADDTITIMVHLRDKIIPIHCGFGTQQVIWLGYVAIARYVEDADGIEGGSQGWLHLGNPAKIMRDGKQELTFTDIICDVLHDRNHVYVSTSLG